MAVEAQPWKQQWIDVNRKTFKMNFFVDFKTERDVLVFACKFLAVLIQHGVGGGLCIPSALGLTGPVVCAMARHGALCEGGFELQDVVVRAWQIIAGGKEGRAMNPAALVMIMTIHHAMVSMLEE